LGNTTQKSDKPRKPKSLLPSVTIMGFKSKLKSFWNQKIEIHEPNIFEMTKAVLTQYQNRHNSGIFCVRCGQPILVGQAVRRKIRRAEKDYEKPSKWTDYYHLDCWRELFCESVEQPKKPQEPNVFLMCLQQFSLYCKRHGHEPKCPRCQQPIKLNQIVKAQKRRKERMRSVGRVRFVDHYTEYYHLSCWESMSL
jgi:ribosomal protein L34E